MFDAFCKLDKGARCLLEAGFLVAASGRPILGEHRKPGFAATPPSLVCVGLRSSQQHAANSPALVFGIHLQMPYRKRLRRVVVRCTTKDVPSDLVPAFFNGSQCKRTWILASKVCCDGVNIPRRIIASYPDRFAPVVWLYFRIPCSAKEELTMSKHLLALLTCGSSEKA